MSYYVNEPVTLYGTFKTLAGVLTNPTTVALTIGDATGTPTTYTFAAGELVNVSTGVFSRAFVPETAGTWLARWVSTGIIDSVDEYEFDVVASSAPWAPAAYPPTYASLGELLAGLRLDSTDTVDEFELRRCLQEASREIDGEVARRSLGAVTKFYDDVDWPTVPAPIRRATVLLAIALYKRSQAPFGVLESSLDGTPIQVGKDFHVDALITSVVPWNVGAL